MICYEEYNSPSEKRKAQRESIPLKRMHPTGKSKGYLLVFNEDGMHYSGNIACFEAYGDQSHKILL